MLMRPTNNIEWRKTPNGDIVLWQEFEEVRFDPPDWIKNPRYRPSGLLKREWRPVPIKDPSLEG